MQTLENTPLDFNLTSKEYGTYKLAFSAENNELLTSIRFGVGWQADSQGYITSPDKLNIKLECA